MPEQEPVKKKVALVDNSPNEVHRLGNELLRLGYAVNAWVLIDQRFVFGLVDQKMKDEAAGEKAGEEQPLLDNSIYHSTRDQGDLIKRVLESDADALVVLHWLLATLVSQSEMTKGIMNPNYTPRPVITYTAPEFGTSLAIFQDKSTESGLGSEEGEFFELLRKLLA